MFQGVIEGSSLGLIQFCHSMINSSNVEFNKTPQAIIDKVSDLHIQNVLAHIKGANSVYIELTIPSHWQHLIHCDIGFMHGLICHLWRDQQIKLIWLLLLFHPHMPRVISVYENLQCLKLGLLYRSTVGAVSSSRMYHLTYCLFCGLLYTTTLYISDVCVIIRYWIQLLDTQIVLWHHQSPEDQVDFLL